MCVYVCPETTAGIRLRSQASRQAKQPRSQNFFPFLNFEKGKKYCERAVVAGATHNPVALGAHDPSCTHTQSLQFLWTRVFLPIQNSILSTKKICKD